MACSRPLYVTYNNGQFGRFGGLLTQSVLDAYKDSETEVVPVPCGKCPGCRLDRAKVWADRMLLEFNKPRDTYPAHTALFLTLTYNDKSRYMVPCSDGVMRASLCVRDTQLFLKKLRKFLPHKVRFFNAGEYGDTTFRPHYHMILFGCSLADFPDSVVWSKDPDLENILYKSSILDDLWGKGNVLFAPATYGTMCYVGQYVIKKQYISDNFSDFYKGRKPPFITMSRNPGIGADSFSVDSLCDDVILPSVAVSDGEDVHVVKVPRYYLDKLRVDFPEIYDIIKEYKREIASSTDSLVKERIGENYFDYLRSCERSLVSRRRSRGRRDKI